ncbi:reverse transcriptase domain-containing protein [Tanacetum coccineum]
MTPRLDILFDFLECDGGSVQLGDNRECKIRGIGKVRVQLKDGSSFVLHNVRYIPELKRNLISLGTLEKEGFTVKLQSGKVKVINGSRVVLSGIRRDNCVYSLDGHAMAGELNASVEEKGSLAQVWHKRLGHISDGTTGAGKAGAVCQLERRKGSKLISEFHLESKGDTPTYFLVFNRSNYDYTSVKGPGDANGIPFYAERKSQTMDKPGKGSEASKIILNEQCSVVILNKVPPKEKDPGGFTISFIIGQSGITKALADLGASISLMPYSMFLQLNLDIIDLFVLDIIKEILPPNHANSIEPILDHLSTIHEDCNNPALFAANSNDEEKNLLQKTHGAPFHLGICFSGTEQSRYYLMEEDIWNEYYCFLDGFPGYFQIPLALEDQEKTTFTCPYGTFAYRRMPFGLCNAPATFQRCMTTIFHGMSSCEEMNLVLNWEKCHFMVKEGIVLGHKISRSGIKVDKAKFDVIASLPYPTNVKGIRSFLGHAGFYRRFIKDFSKIARPMTQLLMKDAKFDFSDECIKSFDILRDKLITAL